NKRYKKLLIFIAAWLWLNIGHAQNVKDVFVTVQSVLNFELVKNVTSSVNFNTATHFTDGVTLPNFVTVKIKSNRTWAFGVSSTTANFSASGTYASSNMPSQVLSMRQGDQAQYQPLSTTTKILTTGSAGNVNKTGNTFNISMKA